MAADKMRRMLCHYHSIAPRLKIRSSRVQNWLEFQPGASSRQKVLSSPHHQRYTMWSGYHPISEL